MATQRAEYGVDDAADLAGTYAAMYYAEAGSIKFTVRLLTPQWAADVLANKNGRNRKLKAGTAAGISEEITAGRWRLNGEAIVFNTAGELVDGQHRLAAIVQSGIAVPSVVITGVAAESFESHGQSRPRTRGDILSIPAVGMDAGESNTGPLAAALTWVYRWENGRLDSHNLTPRNTEMRSLLDRHPGVRDSLSTASRCVRSVHIPSVTVAMHYLFGLKDAAARDTFFDQLLDGLDVQPGSHMHLLTRWLKNNVSRLKSHEYPQIAAVMIKTWNRIRTDQPPATTLVWKPNESFPEIV